MKKEDFYKFVRDGKITLEYTEETLVEASFKPIINIVETKRTSAYGEVKAARLAFLMKRMYGRCRNILMCSLIVIL